MGSQQSQENTKQYRQCKAHPKAWFLNPTETVLFSQQISLAEGRQLEQVSLISQGTAQ